MAESLILNGNSSITKGTVIFEKGQPLQSTALILKGRVIVQGEGVRMTIGSGNFLGMCDVWKKEHSFTYVALDDLVLFGLPMENEKQAALLLEQKPQYRGLLVTSLNFFYHDVFRVFGKLKTETEKLSKTCGRCGSDGGKNCGDGTSFKPADGELFVAGKNHVFYSVQ